MSNLESSGRVDDDDDVARNGIFRRPIADYDEDGLSVGVSRLELEALKVRDRRIAFVKVTHCGVLHVLDLSAREWLRVALGRTIATPQCTGCQGDLPLPVTRAEARWVLRLLLGQAWLRLAAAVSLLLSKWRTQLPWYVLLLILQLVAALGAGGGELWARHSGTLDPASRFLAWLAGAFGALVVLNVIWWIVAWVRFRAALRARALDLLGDDGPRGRRL